MVSIWARAGKLWQEQPCVDALLQRLSGESRPDWSSRQRNLVGIGTGEEKNGNPAGHFNVMEVTMMRNHLFVLAVITLSCFSGCGTSNSKSTQIEGVTFVDKGGVALDPAVTTVTIDSQTMRFSLTQGGQPVSQWSRQIQFSDYTSVHRVVTDYNLLERGDVNLPPGAPQECVGGMGMSITITSNKGVHSFDISGDVSCNRSLWPEGVRNLVTLEDALLAKYAQQRPFSSVRKGQVAPNGNNTVQLAVIRNEADWASFWDLLYANHSPKPALPPIDFTGDVVVALVDRERPTGGYSVTITDIRAAASGITVSASQVSPGPACVVTQAFTQPFHIVTTPVFSGAATLGLSHSINNCGH